MSKQPTTQTFECQGSNCGNNLINPQVNNFGPKVPIIQDLQIALRDSTGADLPKRDKDGHALTSFKFYTDAGWDDPKFKVVCDRPCRGYDVTLLHPTVIISPTFEWASSPNDEDMVVFVLTTLRPLRPDTYYLFTVASEDADPVTILSVNPFTGRIRPQP